MAGWGIDAAGSPEALFVVHHRSLLRLARAVLDDSDVAEEVVMDVFVDVFARPDRVLGANDPAAYLRRMVLNRATSRIRRRMAERRANRRLVSRPAAASVGVDAGDLRREVAAAIRLLPPRQRACVALRYFEDLPEAEVAAAMGISVGTVKSQLAKARAHLLSALASQPLEVLDA